jgi:hypothetical protein
MEIFPHVVVQAILSFLDIIAYIEKPLSILIEENPNLVFGIDMSIEGLRSQKFSKGIFVFLILSLILFSFIIWLYLPKKNKKSSKLKRGEKIMLGAIMASIVLAVVIGWIQLVECYLI